MVGQAVMKQPGLQRIEALHRIERLGGKDGAVDGLMRGHGWSCTGRAWGRFQRRHRVSTLRSAAKRSRSEALYSGTLTQTNARRSRQTLAILGWTDAAQL